MKGSPPTVAKKTAMQSRLRTRSVVLLAGVLVGASVLGAPDSFGQDDPIDPVPSSSTTTTTSTSSTTTTTATTAPPKKSTTTTTTVPTSTTESPPPSSAPPPTEGDSGGEGDGTTTTGVVPPQAQAVINSVTRSSPNSSAALLEAIQPLIDLGLSREEAIRIGFGSFPIAGEARFSHDWLFPRWGSSGFRYHQGTDIFAAYGTPLRAITDGTLRSSNGGLGGLAVRVVMPDGTYFYYAHLSALAEGFEEGMSVKTGDIIGYVGDSGNARGGSPHLHLGIYLPSGEAVDPKAYLDQFLSEAMERLPSVIEQVRASRQTTATTAQPRRPRALLASALLQELIDRTAAGEVTTETLYQASANPSTGGIAVAESHARGLAATIDWEARELQGDLDPNIQRILDLTADALRGAGGGAERAGE